MMALKKQIEYLRYLPLYEFTNIEMLLYRELNALFNRIGHIYY